MAYSDELWAEAKKKCRLNQEDIALAKRLGLNPRSLIKNIPNKSGSSVECVGGRFAENQP